MPPARSCDTPPRRNRSGQAHLMVRPGRSPSKRSSCWARSSWSQAWTPPTWPGNPDASLSARGAFHGDGSQPDAGRDERVPAASPDSDFPLLATTSDERRASTSTRSRSAPGHTASRSSPAGGSAHTRKAGNPLATPLGVAEGMDETTISSHTGPGCGLYRFCCQEAQDVAANHYESWAFAVLGSPAGF